ncbi:hypothetical protein ACTTAK_06415 [Rhodobacter capsulatus]|uniref:hypothetical protein n=1 Tax=Rhodobacter capsulatus TaxID=1061 RepID=UPI001141C0ED|nr:hypothetical protein [Rhodobacter capsulatus]TQD37485.1 hypothetical protein FKW81_02580 [Rhodobacter capsulatus]
MAQEHIVIRSEDDLFDLLRSFKDQDTREVPEVRFDGWPKWELRIRGEDFNGGVPTRIMPGLLALQKAIDEAYAITVYGAVKRLTKDDRAKTEIVVHLDEGSTVFSAELWEIFNTFAKAAVSNMDGHQTLIAILGTAGLIGAGWSWKAWLSSQAHAKDIDLKFKLSEEETKRQKIVSDLAMENVRLASVKESFETGSAKVMRALHDGDEVVMDGDATVNGEVARQVVRKLPSEAIEARRDGNYRILEVKSGLVRNGFKALVEAVDTKDRINLDIPSGTLTEQQLESLKRGEWEKKPLFMRINVAIRDGQIVRATLSHAGLNE